MPKTKPLSLSLLLRKHREDWGSCTRCPLHEGRAKVVLGRGKLPCDILLIGEAPGESENVLGQPFVGPAGHLLDRIIRSAVPDSMAWAITNLVACIPRQDGSKVSEPDPDDILHCAPRLDEFVRMANPRLIVCVGKLAESWVIGTKGRRHLLAWYNGAMIGIIHPAADRKSVV